MKKKRLFIGFLLALVSWQLASVLVLISPQKTSAATIEWVDVQTIKVDDKNYKDKKLFDSMDYQAGSGCANQIKNFNKDFNPNLSGGDITKAKLYTRNKDPETGECHESNEGITIGRPENFRVWLYWVDEATLRGTDGTRYVYNDEVKKFIQKNSGDCHNSAEVTGDTTARLNLRASFDGCKEGPSFDVNIAESSVENKSKPAGTGGDGADDDVEPEPSCESEGGEMSWLICPVLRMASNAIGALDEEINNLLIVPDSYYTNDRLHQTWGQLRNLALIILVPIMLVMVIGTALGFELVSAYTVKKAMPRLFIAVIFITLSWPLTQFFVQFINDIGSGIAGVLGSAFGTRIDSITLASLFDPGGGGSQDFGIALIGLFGAAGGLALVSIGIILSYAGMALLGLFIGFVLLATRQFLVVALMLFAPLAILAWIFPGNDKLWKLWKESFTKLLLLYPLVIVLISAGRIFAKVVQDVGTGGGDAAAQGFAGVFIKLLAYVGPYFFIPAAFKFAGGIFANVAGMANDRSRGLFDRQRKYRAGKMSENWGKTKNYSRFSDKGRVGRKLNTMLGAGASPKDIYGAALGRGSIAAGKRTGRINQGADAYKNDPTMAAHANDENFNMALMSESLAQQNLKATEAKYNDARNRHTAANASGDTAGALAAQEDMNKHLATMDAQRNGIENAKRVKNRNSSAVRLAALNQLAASGYGFSQGKEGYKELSNAVDEITGGDQAARAEAMNTAQFNLKNAGRYELGGINNGAGYDPEAGLAKVDPYTEAVRAKPETIQAKGQIMRDSIQKAVAARNSGDMATYNQQMEKAETLHQEMKVSWSSATGKNKDTYFAELATVEGPEVGPKTVEQTEIKTYGEASSPASYNATPVPRRVDYNPANLAHASWGADDIKRGWRTENVVPQKTNAQRAQEKARGTRMPRPEELEP